MARSIRRQHQQPPTGSPVQRELRVHFAGLPPEVAALLAPPWRDDNGFLHVEGIAALGECVYTYIRNQDGAPGLWRVYRPGSVVFGEQFLRSLQGAPLTLQHPEAFLTPDTVQASAVGAVLSARANRERGLVIVEAVLQGAEAIRAFEGGMTALSTGETCIEVSVAPGTQIEGLVYDAVMTSAFVNHLAVVDAGAAGPLAQIRAHALPTQRLHVLSPNATPNQEKHVDVEITLPDGTKIMVPKAVADMIAAREKELADLKAKVENMEGQLGEALKNPADGEEMNKQHALALEVAALTGSPVAKVGGKETPLHKLPRRELLLHALAPTDAERKAYEGYSEERLHGALDWRRKQHAASQASRDTLLSRSNAARTSAAASADKEFEEAERALEDLRKARAKT